MNKKIHCAMALATTTLAFSSPLQAGICLESSKKQQQEMKYVNQEIKTHVETDSKPPQVTTQPSPSNSRTNFSTHTLTLSNTNSSIINTLSTNAPTTPSPKTPIFNNKHLHIVAPSTNSITRFSNNNNVFLKPNSSLQIPKLQNNNQSTNPITPYPSDENNQSPQLRSDNYSTESTTSHLEGLDKDGFPKISSNTDFNISEYNIDNSMLSRLIIPTPRSSWNGNFMTRLSNSNNDPSLATRRSQSSTNNHFNIPRLIPTNSLSVPVKSKHMKQFSSGKLIHFFLGDEVNLDVIDEDTEENIVHTLARHCDNKKIQEILNKREDLANQEDGEGNLPISSIFLGKKSPFEKKETAQILLKYKPDIDHQNIQQETLLQTVSRNPEMGDFIIELVNKHNANIHMTNSLNEDALHTASRACRPGNVKALLKLKANKKKKTRKRQTALEIAQEQLCFYENKLKECKNKTQKIKTTKEETSLQSQEITTKKDPKTNEKEISFMLENAKQVVHLLQN